MAEHLYAANATGAPGAGGPEAGAATAGGGASANGDPGEKADDVIDVEFEEKK
jgi:molecular chaperone DnaK